ncbi:uncharacterized protein F4822DRAFT_432976 [Hypoxylon trugodes]|uniref:uncharacterized protein n=1 Tax=Hypoxylon trugodes TaxID=326681 RepID=UPI0021936235|nr:uncharacterized protein F4822DRAFT_432976 [Hypoxylon trugodes]KAI1384431.1 hypothetical protein F4822DRAFT_432976 [Hypoxylon trugodes]
MPSQTSMMAIVRDNQTQPAESANTGEKRASNTRDEAGVGKKKRVRNFTPNDRAAHRVFEKLRREAFREKLIELASFLPTLSETEPNRLSKHIVVHESIERHREQNQHIQELQRERDELLAEVNRWRAAASTGATVDVPLEARTAQSFVYRTVASGDWDVFPNEGIAAASEGFNFDTTGGVNEIGSPSRSATGLERDPAALVAAVPPPTSQGSVPTQSDWATHFNTVSAPTTAATTHVLSDTIPTTVANERISPDQSWLEPPSMMGDGRPWDFEVRDLHLAQMQLEQTNDFDPDPTSIPLLASLEAFHNAAGDARPDQAGFPQRLDHTPFMEEPLSSLDQLYWGTG